MSSEHIRTLIVDDHDELGRVIAHRLAEVVRARAAEGRHAVLGLATGSTPIGAYRELIRLHREEGLDFSDVVTFNLDEYYGLQPDSIHSYHRYMWENLFSHINIKRENVHIPRGDVPRGQVEADCAAYEAAI
ncbi:MAG: 6-phosphogluconolactonase, partial [Gemmatimonadales bacterium]